MNDTTSGRNAGTVMGKARLSFGIVTDAHYAQAEPGEGRQYSESLDKMAECVELMNARRVDFLVDLGDCKDQGDPACEAETLGYLETIERVFSRFRGPRYHVLGNHDADSISKDQFLSRVENTGIARHLSSYSFDSGNWHFVVLDANYRADGSGYDHGGVPDKPYHCQECSKSFRQMSQLLQHQDQKHKVQPRMIGY